MVRKLVAVAALFSVLLTALVLSNAAGAVPPSDSSPTPRISWPNNVNAAALAGEAVDEVARNKWSNIYGGISLAKGGNQLVVHLTTLANSAALNDLNIAAMAQSIKPTFVSSPTTVVQQQAMQDTVTADYGRLKTAGIILASWAVDGYTKRESITTLNGTKDQLTRLKSMFGPNVEVSSVSTLPTATADRGTDYAPFNGGDWGLTAVAIAPLVCLSTHRTPTTY